MYSSVLSVLISYALLCFVLLEDYFITRYLKVILLRQVRQRVVSLNYRYFLISDIPYDKSPKKYNDPRKGKNITKT